VSATTTAGRDAPALDRRRFEAVKEAVTVPALAEDLGGELRKVGDRWRGRCALCGNGSNSDAFSAGERLWNCFACGEGGDVVTLAALANDMAPAMAASWIADRFGIELPRRSDRWHEAQDHKARVREAAVRQVALVYQRRLVRVYSPLVLLGGETPEQEIRELEDLARSLWPISLSWAEGRVHGG
jgi:hypothetical protein